MCPAASNVASSPKLRDRSRPCNREAPSGVIGGREGKDVELTAVQTIGDTEGLDAAVRKKHEAWLVGRLALIVGDREEAKDLAQQTFMRAAEFSTEVVVLRV
jgi:hypothetical protein